DDLAEPGPVRRLNDIGIRTQFINLLDVAFRTGACENDDRDDTQRRISLHFRQDGTAVLPRHIQVEQNQVGTYSFRVIPLPAQESQGFLAVRGDAEVDLFLASLQRFPGEADIAWVVLD